MVNLSLSPKDSMDEIQVMKNNDSHEDLDKKDLIRVLNLCLDLPCDRCVIADVCSFLLFGLLRIFSSVLDDEMFCFCMSPNEVSFTTSNNEESDSDDDFIGDVVVEADGDG